MELRQLRYFQAVVEAGSLSAAALNLHISQPPLGVAISKLEAELQVTLLTRTSRGVEPTAAGIYLLDASAKLLEDADTIVSTLARFESGLEGSITMAAVPVLMWHRIPRLLKLHAASHPGVDIRLTTPPPWEAIDLLQRKRVDLAAIMVANPEAFIARHGDAFDFLDWGPAPLVAVLPEPDGGAETANNVADPLPAAALTGQVLMMPPRIAAVPSLPEALDRYLHEQQIVPASVRNTETISSGISLIEAGIAVGVLPDPDLQSFARFPVVTRRLIPEPAPLTTLVLTRRGETPTPALREVLAQIAAMPVTDGAHAHQSPTPKDAP